MKRYVPELLLLSLLTAACAAPARATSLAGSAVTGSLNFSGDPANYFDPVWQFVPAGNYLNGSATTVQVSNSATEFGFDDGASFISADFTSTGLTIGDLIELAGPANAFVLTFTDAAFAGTLLTLTSGNSLLMNYSLSGSTLTLGYSAGNASQGTNNAASFVFTAVPEPGQFLLVGCLLLGSAAARISKLRARVGQKLLHEVGRRVTDNL